MSFIHTIKQNTCTCTWKTSCGRSIHRIFEQLRAAGKEVVLLESGNGGWTFIGIVNPAVAVPEGEAGFKFMRGFLREKSWQDLRQSPQNPQQKLQQDFRAQKFAGPDAPPFTRGFAGFVSYDLGTEWSGVKQRVKKDIVCPKTHFVYVDKVFAFRADRMKLCLFCAASRHLEAQSGGGRTYKISAPKSNLTQKQYFGKIRKIKNYLYSGETYQVNFSQRFTVPFKGDAFELYRKITKINPSPFQFFMETPDFAVISNSPERLLCIRDEIIETRPIKGTSPRGRNAEEDGKNIARLLASEKERAELAMIVDLERNDVGRLCIPGTVEVSENRTIEKYSHVIHTVANIRGVLPEQYDWYDALRALHPGGSITGCPKKRTVKIIDRLENYSRGVYCGAAGYIDVSGNCDFNIMIRTLWLEKDGKTSKLIFHSGGGIVVDSDPEKEYAETLHKAEALISAIYETGSQSSIRRSVCTCPGRMRHPKIGTKRNGGADTGSIRRRIARAFIG